MGFKKNFFLPLHYTDQAGVIFYSRLFEFCQLTLEEFFISKKLEFHKQLKKKVFPFIVEAKANYFKPMVWGSNFSVLLSCKKIGSSSFIIKYDFLSSGETPAVNPSLTPTLLASSETIHVFTEQGVKTKIPSEFKNILETLKN